MNPRSDSARMITEFSNNQNSVKARDFKANNQIQIRLQNEMSALYEGQYVLEIKRGELLGAGTIISNEDAGVYLEAFDLGEPWATHRKHEIFEDKHAELFGRPEVTADRIVLLKVIMEAIEQEIPSIKNKLFGRYVLTRYLLLYVIREIFRNDGLAEVIMTKPETFVRNPAERDKFRKCVGMLITDVVIDLNGEVDELGEGFDYRDKLRDQEWVIKTSKKIVNDYQVRVKRKRISSFQEEWETPANEPKVAL
jgi:hypothetical protein